MTPLFRSRRLGRALPSRRAIAPGPPARSRSCASTIRRAARKRAPSGSRSAASGRSTNRRAGSGCGRRSSLAADARWASSESIDAQIRHVYQSAPRKNAVNALAERIQRPRWWVSKRARQLGLVAPRFKEPDVEQGGTRAARAARAQGRRGHRAHLPAGGFQALGDRDPRQAQAGQADAGRWAARCRAVQRNRTGEVVRRRRQDRDALDRV